VLDPFGRLRGQWGDMSESSESSAVSPKLTEAQELFILEWGNMSSSWGINRTLAQIHALLYITGERMTTDQIIERLRISRGNASTNLRELMAWGLVRRFRRPGERRDEYYSESDIWHMFARVVRERKRREVDPTVTALRQCLDLIRGEPPAEPIETYRARVQALLDVFGLLDEVFRDIVADDDTLREVFDQGLQLRRQLSQQRPSRDG
jgi:DNA-binding transcriptional regulator GbsR (MarR family)